MDFVPYLENCIRNRIKLCIVDLFIINPSTFKVYKSLSTNSKGFVTIQCFEPQPVQTIAGNLLANMSNTLTQSPEHKKIVNFIYSLGSP